MSDIAEMTKSIVVEDTFPHAPAVVWRALTEGGLMAKWIMPPTGFAAVVGQEFTFQTKPLGKWDGTIHCQVLTVEPERTLAYSWAGGADDNAGYGSRLNTVVTMTLEATAGGTRLRLEHAGFDLPRNAVAYQNMSDGWKVVMGRFGNVLPEAGDGQNG
ncbi:MAG: SRPBCC domain-containing protein [bacterium]